ncbi:MAG: DUF3820 family protein [Chlamydiia bacterium]|nr:DUF3820 family protein [Chlamydiia bacterium]
MKKTAIYYDTETTGTRPGKDRVIEIAALDPARGREFCTFIQPEMLIPPEATAIHGISNEMVSNAPLIKDALASFVDFCSGDTVLIAHNNDAFDKLFLDAEFQRAQLSMPAWPFIDSLKWSRKYRNDLPRHSLQFLREVYGIAANQAHRALDDCAILHQVFSRMIDDLPLETVLDLLSKQLKIVRMPFGKYSGKLLKEVPKDYFSWLEGSGALEKQENKPLKEALKELGVLA